MTAVLVLARRALIQRWRSALALTLLVGVVGAIILASAAGAHRSSTSLPRFVAWSRASDAEIDLDGPTAAQLRAFRRVPAVKDFAVLHSYALAPDALPDLKNAASVDGRIGTYVDRARVVAGRAADPNSPDEIMIGEGLAAKTHLGIGDYLDASTLTPAQLALTFQNKNSGPPAGPKVHLLIVGIYRRPLDLGDLAASGGVVVETPAFDREYAGRAALYSTVLRVRASAGQTGVPSVTAAARTIFGKSLRGVVDVSAEARGGADAINVLTLALWAFAGVAALAGAIALAIVIARDVAQAEIDQPMLKAIGLTRRQCIATLGVRVLLIVSGGAVVATLIAIAASPLFPIGIARRAEPSPGVRADWLVLGVGIVGIVVFITLVGLLAAIRATRPTSAAAATRGQGVRRSLADLIARSGLRPPAANGLRMATEPGRGPTAVPVRSAVFGAVFGVVGVTGALVFAASFGQLAASPHLYGWTWDFKAPDDTFTPGCGASDYGLGAVSGVAADAAVCYQTGLVVGGRPTTGWGFTQIHGTIDPEIVAGTAPRGSSEVALGAATMRALGKKIGDTVPVAGARKTFEYRVVGQVVLPPLQAGEIQPLADGAAFSASGFAPIADASGDTRYLIGKFAPGVDRDAVLHRVDAISAFQAPTHEQSFVGDSGASLPTNPPEVNRLRAINWFPPLLAALISVLALVAVGHAIVTTTRRRRAELALLKTFGFERRQVRATLAWQVTALALMGLIVGIPVGIGVGGAVWSAVAGGLGIASVVVVPVIALVVIVPSAIAVMNAVAALPARSAARMWPAPALAEE